MNETSHSIWFVLDADAFAHGTANAARALFVFFHQKLFTHEWMNKLRNLSGKWTIFVAAEMNKTYFYGETLKRRVLNNCLIFSKLHRILPPPPTAYWKIELENDRMISFWCFFHECKKYSCRVSHHTSPEALASYIPCPAFSADLSLSQFIRCIIKTFPAKIKTNVQSFRAPAFKCSVTGRGHSQGPHFTIEFILFPLVPRQWNVVRNCLIEFSFIYYLEAIPSFCWPPIGPKKGSKWYWIIEYLILWTKWSRVSTKTVPAMNRKIVHVKNARRFILPWVQVHYQWCDSVIRKNPRRTGPSQLKRRRQPTANNRNVCFSRSVSGRLSLSRLIVDAPLFRTAECRQALATPIFLVPYFATSANHLWWSWLTRPAMHPLSSYLWSTRPPSAT